VFLQASDRKRDHLGTLLRQLLRYFGEWLGVLALTIASLSTLY
jgi:hypothetical protein